MGPSRTCEIGDHWAPPTVPGLEGPTDIKSQWVKRQDSAKPFAAISILHMWLVQQT